MNDASENDASLLPGNMTERTFTELWAARREVEVMYSLRWMGASVICSAMVRNVCTARPNTGRVTVVPPNKARSRTVVVTPTAVVATPLARENLRNASVSWKWQR